MIFSNPILIREIEHRMRDNRTYWIPTVYMFVLSLVVIGVYITMALDPNIDGWIVGKTIFHSIGFVQMGIVTLLVPSISSVAITGERDKGTLPVLLITPMPRWHITTGKFIASFLYILMLVSTSIIFSALSFGLGGVDIPAMGITYICILTSTLFFSSLGLAISTFMKRTIPAILLTYVIVAFVIIGSIIGQIIQDQIIQQNQIIQDSQTSPHNNMTFLYLNPFIPLILNMTDEMIFNYDTIPRWWITLIIYILISALSIAIANYRISRMRE